jgi:hypothetical protein
MSQDVAQPSTDLAAPMPRAASAIIMSPANYRTTWSMCRTLAASGSFKDIGRAGLTGPALDFEAAKALSRILLGADLGMSPTQALLGIDIVKGNPQIRGVALGRMVRETAKRPTPAGESYDYKVLRRDFTEGAQSATVALYRRDEDGTWPRVEDEEGEPFDTILGTVTIPKGRKCPEAVEAFVLSQAEKRKLVKEDGAWQTHPEVMVVWRALSQLVRFFAPDVIGGVPVYTEADHFDETPAEQVGAAAGGHVDVVLPEAVEGVIARAKALGDEELSSRDRVAMIIGGQSDEAVGVWVAEQLQRLDALEPEDATVVEDDGEKTPEQRAEALRERAATFRTEANLIATGQEGYAGRLDEVEPLRAEAERLDAEAGSIENGAQGALL